MNDQKKYLILSVDTEPDNHRWRPLTSRPGSILNAAALPRFIDEANLFKVKPTFLLTHSMAGSDLLRKNLEASLKDGTAEVGMHLHPGETPPFTSFGVNRSDNICVVPQELLLEKFHTLYTLITKNFGMPLSFRGAAWALDSRMFMMLSEYGFLAESSVTPGISWKLLNRPSYWTAPHCAYTPHRDNPSLPGISRVIEVPVTIWQRTRLPQWIGEYAASVLTMPLSSKSHNPLISLIRHLRPAAPLWLCPAFTTADQMKQVVDKMESRTDFLHVMCHSSELLAGASPYNPTEETVIAFYDRLRTILSYITRKGYVPVTLAEYVRIHHNKTAVVA